MRRSGKGQGRAFKDYYFNRKDEKQCDKQQEQAQQQQRRDEDRSKDGAGAAGRRAGPSSSSSLTRRPRARLGWKTKGKKSKLNKRNEGNKTKTKGIGRNMSSQQIIVILSSAADQAGSFHWTLAPTKRRYDTDRVGRLISTNEKHKGREGKKRKKQRRRRKKNREGNEEI